ncbi:hypothetical protein [Parabacteroides distasonis]|uniref:hypothetical protein n=1 Tax=Parabacteroides distasonis TaxID=823 RepID=UPI003219EE27
MEQQQFKGTIGQWHRAIKRGGAGRLVGVTRNNFQPLCEILYPAGYGMTTEEVEANANLVNAAPDLLNALVEITNLLEEREPDWYLRKHYNLITSALNKAFGNNSG